VPAIRTDDATRRNTVLRDYLQRLFEQRQSHRAPAHFWLGTRCPPTPPASVPVLVNGHAPSLYTVQVCSYGPFPGSAFRGTLSPGQVAQVNADIATHATRRPTSASGIGSCKTSHGLFRLSALLGVGSWGDELALSSQCSVYTFMDREGTWYWSPTEQTAAMLASVLQPVRHPTGRISGRLLAVGGPAGTPNRPLSGTVELRGGDEGWISLQIEPDGAFEKAVPPGRYTVVGHSPLYQSNAAPCFAATRVVTVRPHATTKVSVTCEER